MKDLYDMINGKIKALDALYDDYLDIIDNNDYNKYYYEKKLIEIRHQSKAYLDVLLMIEEKLEKDVDK